MNDKILKYGIAAGLIVGLPLFVMMMTTSGEPLFRNGALIGYTTMLIALSTVFLAVKRQRDLDGGGVTRFWPAFTLGLGISAVASLVYMLAWEAALAASGADFISAYTQAMIAREQAAGATPETLASMRAELDAFARSYANPLFRMPLTFIEMFPVGVLVSLVSAALLRNPRFLPARRSQPA